MNIIKTLPPHVANLIAAGEVVERPSSVIKELMENCVDAGAENITCEIKNGGIELIRIQDNGCGMSRDDAQACFIRHATSKISTQADLSAILTLGFRGEALAAISAVSKIELRTRRAEDMVGTRVICEGGKILSVEDDGCPIGTSISVREIFYNTPARMKFLKKNSTEASYCAAAVDHIALSHPEIAVRFIKDSRISMRTPGDGKAASAIAGVCGHEFYDSLIPIPELKDISTLSSRPQAWGYVTRPERALSGRGSQNFILNGRHVHSRTLTAALEEAYRGSIMTGKYPGCVIYLAIDPAHVDVNVHPAKLEIKFSDERAAFQAVYEAVKGAFAESDRPHFTAAAAKEPVLAKPEPAYQEASEPKAEPEPERTGRIYNMTVNESRFSGELHSDAPILELYKNSHSINPVIDISADDFDIDAPASDESSAENKEKIESSAVDAAVAPSEAPESILPLDELFPANEPQDASSNETIKETYEDSEVLQTEIADMPAVPEYRIIGEAFRSYIIVELENELMYIDKHAAHERIIYNKLCAAVTPPPGQILLAPLVLPISRSDLSLMEENAEELSRLGLDFADFGGGNVIISSVPSYIDPDDAADLIEEVCSRIRRNENDDRRENILHSISCKAAIKAGWITHPQEIDALVREVLSNDDLRYCPHGRPVALIISKKDFEKEFFRT